MGRVKECYRCDDCGELVQVAEEVAGGIFCVDCVARAVEFMEWCEIPMIAV